MSSTYRPDVPLSIGEFHPPYFTNGQCHALALQLNAHRPEWPISLIGHDKESGFVPVHAVVKPKYDQYLDANGLYLSWESIRRDWRHSKYSIDIRPRTPAQVKKMPKTHGWEHPDHQRAGKASVVLVNSFESYMDSDENPPVALNNALIGADVNEEGKLHILKTNDPNKSACGYNWVEKTSRPASEWEETPEETRCEECNEIVLSL